MSLARRWRSWEVAARRGDVFIVLVTLVVIAAVIAYAVHDDQPLTLVLIPAAVAAILLRRRHSGAALLLAVVVDCAIPANRALGLPAMVVLYTIALRAQWRVAAAAVAGAAAMALIAGAVWGGSAVSSHEGLLGYAIGSTASLAVAAALGLYVGARRRVLDGLRERAERLDRERELLADRAVAQERTRIAQELHDVVAHNVSLMVVEAQALGATVHDAKVAESTDAIADLGRHAVAEMHTTLRLLRADSDAPELAPQPGLEQLDRLLEQLRRAGLQVELRVEGQRRQLAQGVDLSAFRIVQEALTNVVKHARDASAKVKVAYTADGLELTIIDTEAHAAGMPGTAPSDGHGLIGMRERAALFGGSLSAESMPDGFKVTATLPYEPAPR